MLGKILKSGELFCEERVTGLSKGVAERNRFSPLKFETTLLMSTSVRINSDQHERGVEIVCLPLVMMLHEGGVADQALWGM